MLSSNSGRLARFGLAWILLCLLFLNLPLAAADPAEPAADELKELSRALRENWTQKRYDRLAQFAAREGSRELGVQAAFALGFGDFQQKRFDRARRNFEKAQRSTLLDDYADYYLALTLAELDRPAEAARALEDFATRHPSSILIRAALERQADLLLILGRPEHALALLRAYPDTAAQPELILLLARVLEATGDLAEAARAYQRVYYEFPLSPEANSAWQPLRELGRRLGPRFPQPTLNERLGRADKLSTGRRYRAAIEEYRRLVGELAAADKEKARVRVGVGLYQIGQTKAALEQLSAVAPEDAELDAERLATIAQCYRRQDRETEMAVIIGELARKHPASAGYEDTLFAAANYYFLRKDSRNAVSYYQTVAERFPSGRYAANAHWKVAWQAYLEGSRTAALRLLEEHITRFANSSHQASALYWLGRLAQEAAEAARARAHFAKLLERFPHSYWANRAEERLREPPAVEPASPATAPALLAALPAPAPIARVDGPVPPEAEVRRKKAEALETLALGALALDELRAGYEKTGASALLLPMARLAAGEQRYLLAFEFARRIAPEVTAYPLAAVPREVWEILFPRPYWDEIRREAERNGLDPLLVAALIRQESGFQTEATSSQGAIGLMQVLPRTGRKLARELRLRYRTARLYEPDYNLRLGTHYLAKLMQEFGNDLESALASYNAGEQRVQAWRAERTYREPAEFVEAIPFTETRDYVQIIARNYNLYRRLYGEEADLKAKAKN